MKIYISGISGTGMGPLALMAKEAGCEVFGSDLAEGAIYPELVKAGIEVKIGPQDGEFLRRKLEAGVDWFVHTSALPPDHVELSLARAAGVKITKRDELTAYLIEKLGLKLVAVAGTHGKTTTTSMIVWTALKLGLPVSYIVGTTLGFAPSGAYQPGDRYFIYEADEYDRNFLKFHPWLAVITTVSYDHPDIYSTREEYAAAFEQFKAQSEQVIESAEAGREFKLAGSARRYDAGLAATAILRMQFDDVHYDEEGNYVEDVAAEVSPIAAWQALDEFPGVGRRFEKLADGFYSDYAHHPEEIAATLDVAKDECRLRGKKGVVVVYQPHQNSRQHEVKEGYKTAFFGATKVFWLPTYLTRENPELEVLSSEDLMAELEDVETEAAEMSDELFSKLQSYAQDRYLVLLMTAGPADGWLRKKLGV